MKSKLSNYINKIKSKLFGDISKMKSKLTESRSEIKVDPSKFGGGKGSAESDFVKIGESLIPNLKLYKVTLSGLISYKDIDYTSSYVVALNSEEAYQKVKKYLYEKDYGSPHERELYKVKLLADANENTGVGVRLFV